MRWRSFILLALLASEGSRAAASGTQPQLPEGVLDEDAHSETRVVHVRVPDPLIPASASHGWTPAGKVTDEQDAGFVPAVSLDTVTWSVPEAMTVGTLAQKWGLRQTQLRALNPQLAARATGQPCSPATSLSCLRDRRARRRSRLARRIAAASRTEFPCRRASTGAFAIAGSARMVRRERCDRCCKR